MSLSRTAVALVASVVMAGMVRAVPVLSPDGKAEWRMPLTMRLPGGGACVMFAKDAL